VTLLSTASGCLRSLAGFACAVALLTSAYGVAPFTFPSGQSKSEGLKEAKTIKGQKLTAYRPEPAQIHRKSPKEMPANFERPREGNEKPAPRPAPFHYLKGNGRPIHVSDRWDKMMLARDRSLLPDRRGHGY
jgi:hypothetical protein